MAPMADSPLSLGCVRPLTPLGRGGRYEDAFLPLLYHEAAHMLSEAFTPLAPPARAGAGAGAGHFLRAQIDAVEPWSRGGLFSRITAAGLPAAAARGAEGRELVALRFPAARRHALLLALVEHGPQGDAAAGLLRFKARPAPRPLIFVRSPEGRSAVVLGQKAKKPTARGAAPRPRRASHAWRGASGVRGARGKQVLSKLVPRARAAGGGEGAGGETEGVGEDDSLEVRAARLGAADKERRIPARADAGLTRVARGTRDRCCCSGRRWRPLSARRWRCSASAASPRRSSAPCSLRVREPWLQTSRPPSRGRSLGRRRRRRWRRRRRGGTRGCGRWTWARSTRGSWLRCVRAPTRAASSLSSRVSKAAEGRFTPPRPTRGPCAPNSAVQRAALRRGRRPARYGEKLTNHFCRGKVDKPLLQAPQARARRARSWDS